MENAYLYNLRGSDVKHTPVFFSYSLITPSSVALYLFPEALAEDGDLKSELTGQGVNIKNYFDLSRDLAGISAASILMDPATASYALLAGAPEGCRVVEAPSPLSRMKAIKNATEIASTEKAHLQDGVAMVEFIAWVKKAVEQSDPAAPITELSATDYLEKLRQKQEGFLDLSFSTIAGYGPHGAIVHYNATPETDIPLKAEGFFLVDSGGQYLTGTTDITRTIALGPLTDKMKLAYTAVLKAHIALAESVFEPGTTGLDLDNNIRALLAKYDMSYGHGTGHGVGHILGVHEGPHSISIRGENIPMEPGMISSNEPGYYPEGEFGVRIENIMLCVALSNGKYGFENLTLCPYEKDAIVRNELTPEELLYINGYHAFLLHTLEPLVSPEAAAWLREACEPL